MKALILAGGKSRRMGQNKATIERPDGTRQLDFLVSLVEGLGLTAIVSTNDPDPIPEGIESLPDLNPGDGPIGALASFHARHPEEPVLLIGCDHFLLDQATVKQLLDSIEPGSPPTAFGNRIDGRAEPLCAYYPAEAMSLAQNSIDAEDFCARHFLEGLSPRLLTPGNTVALDNANTPAELDEAFVKLTDGIRSKTIKILYFAKLRESRGLDEEECTSLACTAAGLYEELRFKHRLPLKIDALRCARNGDFCDWNTRLEEGDEIVFIPPVAGG